MFKFIKKKLMAAIENIKFLKELDVIKPNLDTTSQMSIDELKEIQDKLFDQENCICVNGHTQISEDNSK